jgi:carbonic anhydrase/acetyltransferase-like protein (isoleucine patch superfamily)
MTIRSFKGIAPSIHSSCFVEDSAQIIGDVELGEQSSVWFNSVLRGDVHRIRIGRRSNIQDLCVVHVLKDSSPTDLGDDVTVGHQVVLHGCRLGNRILVGMAAVVMDDVEVGDDCLIAAGALVAPRTKIPPGSLVLGSPARVKRSLTKVERAWLLRSAANYVEYARAYLTETKG